MQATSTCRPFVPVSMRYSAAPRPFFSHAAHSLRHQVPGRYPLTSMKRRAHAASETTEVPTTSTSQGPTDSHISILKTAISDKRVPGSQMLSAILALEKSKLPLDNLADVLSGNKKKGGKRWQLIFHAGKEQVSKAMKGEKAGGYFFPITAVQRWDAGTGEIENGTYFGLIAALTFKGPFEITGRKLGFTFDQLQLRLGPKWLNIPLKPGQLGTKKGDDDKKGPFFLFIYADDEIVVARGRGGGVAMWAATTPSWEVKAGVDL